MFASCLLACLPASCLTACRGPSQQRTNPAPGPAANTEKTREGQAAGTDRHRLGTKGNLGYKRGSHIKPMCVGISLISNQFQTISNDFKTIPNHVCPHRVHLECIKPVFGMFIRFESKSIVQASVWESGMPSTWVSENLPI